MPSRISACGFVALLAIVMSLPGCNALNPLCGSARPAPVLTSISPTSVTLAQIQNTVTIVVAGSSFVSSSVAQVNNAEVATVVSSSTRIQASIGPANITAPGMYSISVKTPSGTSGNLGCDSGGTSTQATLCCGPSMEAQRQGLARWILPTRLGKKRSVWPVTTPTSSA